MTDRIDDIRAADGSATVDSPTPQDMFGRSKRLSTRQTVLAGLAGVAVLAAPLVIAKAVVGEEDKSSDVATGTAGALIAQRSTGSAGSTGSTGATDEAGRLDAAQRRSLQLRATTTKAKPAAKPKAKPAAAPPKPAPKPVVKATPPPTAPPTTAAPRPAATVPSAPALPGNGGLGDPNLDATWDHLAQCESGGDWHINTGNGFYGGIQFTLQSWHGVGGSGRPDQASRETQIAMGKRLWQMQGWAAWPGCTAKFGWR